MRSVPRGGAHVAEGRVRPRGDSLRPAPGDAKGRSPLVRGHTHGGEGVFLCEWMDQETDWSLEWGEICCSISYQILTLGFA